MTSAGIPDDAILGDSQEMARVLAEATAKAEAQGDDSGSSMSFGEKKLLLRHRDSFIMTKTHLAESHEGQSKFGGQFSYAGQNETTGELSFEESGAGKREREDNYNDALQALDSMEVEQQGESRSTLPHYYSPRPSLAQGPSPSGLSLDEAQGSPENSPRRKSRVLSFIKGVATVLGLRVSKKNRASAGGAEGGGNSPGTPTRGSSFSSPSGGFSPYAGADGQVDAESFYKGEYDPPRDETGNFVPTHRLHPGPRSILKPTPTHPRSSIEQMNGDYSEAFNASSRSTPREATPRKGLTFADQHGHDLQEVRFSERLHYSGGGETVNWGEESGRKCSIM